MRTRADSPSKTCTVPDCDRPLRARGLCSTHYNRQLQPNRHAQQVYPCAVCNTPTIRGVKNDRRHVCSPQCLRRLLGRVGTYCWETDAAARARSAGASQVELFSAETVFARDEWRCYLCGVLTDRSAAYFGRFAPTVDHIVPLSRGGAHTLDNVRCAHLRCNSSKSDADQLIVQPDNA